MGFLLGCFLALFGIWCFLNRDKVQLFLFQKKSLSAKIGTITKNDLSPKYARATFYVGNDYDHGLSQAEWQKYCNKCITPSLGRNSQAYAKAVAPIANAIVVNDGVYVRRGMENLDGHFERFLPGLNDQISLNYFVEPYEYLKNEELAAKSSAEENLRKQERAKNAPQLAAEHAARRRCDNCIHSNSCHIDIKKQLTCGGYTPRH